MSILDKLANITGRSGVVETSNGNSKVTRNYVDTTYPGYSGAVKDFNSCDPENVRVHSTSKGEIRTGTSGSAKLNAREFSRTGGATFEADVSNSKKIKVRYDKED